MSPRREPANPIKRIKLRITIEGDEPSLARVRKVLKGSRVAGGRLVSLSQTEDPAETIQELVRVGEAVRARPKDFK